MLFVMSVAGKVLSPVARKLRGRLLESVVVGGLKQFCSRWLESFVSTDIIPK